MNVQRLLTSALDIELNNKNILHILNNSLYKNIQNKLRKEEIKTKTIKKKMDDFFYPSNNHTNSLFWCWYIFHNGMFGYNNNINNIYQIEQSEKISYIDVIRKHKNRLKEIKMKRSAIENDIVHELNTSFNSILTLTALFNYNFIFFSDKLYFERIINSKFKTCIIKKTKNKYGIWNSEEACDIFKIKKGKFQVDNFKKPLKNITHYKKNQLEDIFNKLNLTINTNKKITKKMLYAAIQEYII
tara:strand:+ start:237 stop:965 length:729 start_codon:yes stop_codon:yes gene_type:complete